MDLKDSSYQLDWCKAKIDRMLKYAQTKIIFPIITLGLLTEFCDSKQTIFSDSEVKNSYHDAVRYMERYLQHNLHIGGTYYDAYPVRNLPRYEVLKVLDKNVYELTDPYIETAEELVQWIPKRIKQYISDKLGIVPQLYDRQFRTELSEDRDHFLEVLSRNIDRNPVNFEIYSFSIIRVHLEKFACRVYRDTRTSAHDSGVDISTNFGVVYQIKKLKVHTRNKAEKIYGELKMNFDSQRLSDGKVILIIDDISREVKQYLIDMKVQSLSKHDVLKLAGQFDDMEDREKVLRIVHEEFRREYESRIK